MDAAAGGGACMSALMRTAAPAGPPTGAPAEAPAGAPPAGPAGGDNQGAPTGLQRAAAVRGTAGAGCLHERCTLVEWAVVVVIRVSS